jgi:hypothetical protein
MRDEIYMGFAVASWLKDFECERFVIATGFVSVLPGISLTSDRTFPDTGKWWAGEISLFFFNV